MADSTLYTNAVAIYDFENNLNDTKGRYNPSGTGATYATTGEAQGTYWLGEQVGSGVFVCNNDAFLIDEDYAISFWTQCQYMTAGVGPYIRVLNGGFGIGGFGIYIENTLRVQNYNVDTPVQSNFTGYTFADNVRYHIVVSFDASANTITAWVSTTTFGDRIDGTQLTNTQDADIAADGEIRVNHLENYGYYDEVVFWKNTLSSSDAQAIFNARDGGTSWRETGGASSTPTLKRRLNILLRLCLSTFNLIWRCFK